MKKRIGVLLVVLLSLCLAPAARPVLAQGDPGFSEDFEQNNLRGWEHPEEVVVANGVLTLPPNSFALHIGDWSEITLDLTMRVSGEGALLVNSYFRDEARYGVVLRPEEWVLEKSSMGEVTELAHIPAPDVQSGDWFKLQVVVQNGQITVSQDGEQLMTATDPEPLETGAVLLETAGELTAEFDELALTGQPGPGAMARQGMPEGGEEFQEAAPPAAPVQQEPVAAATPAATATTSNGLLQDLMSGQVTRTELGDFVINLLLAAISAAMLGLAYTHWGASLSNRRKFAANFVLMTVTTTFIIMIVRSSVALSLGLVGALSIVRFRTAVKEAEELAYLFFAISLGIGFGDNQRMISLLVLAVGIVIIGVMKLLRRSQADVNLHLTIASHGPRPVDMDQLVAALQPHTAKLKLMRLDDQPNSLEAAFLVEFRRPADLSAARSSLRALSDSIEITFLDNKGLW